MKSIAIPFIFALAVACDSTAPVAGTPKLAVPVQENVKDVPTRQSYVTAVVRPEERTFASGLTHLVRMGAWAVAPSIAGLFRKGGVQTAPLFIGAGLKIVYDVLLYAAFRKVKPPEEEPGSA
jgi:hypothetical protein